LAERRAKDSEMTLREHLHRQLDPEAWPGRGLSPVNWTVFCLIWVSIVFGVSATESSIAGWLGGKLYLIDHLLLAIFAIEYACRLWTCGLNPRFRGVRGFFRYATTPASIADLVVILPLLLPTPPTWILIFRLLRILRLLRLAAMPHIHTAMREFYEALAAKRFEMVFTLFLGVILILLSSTTLYLVEREVQPDVFGSIPKAMWWSVVTFTTVGYGDAVPISTLGKFCAGLFAILGLGLVAMLTGVFASALSHAAELHDKNKRID